MFNEEDGVFWSSELNEAQRDGRACVHCGRSDGGMRPVGVLAGCQVFACVVACVFRNTEAWQTLCAALGGFSREELHALRVEVNRRLDAPRSKVGG